MCQNWISYTSLKYCSLGWWYNQLKDLLPPFFFFLKIFKRQVVQIHQHDDYGMFFILRVRRLFACHKQGFLSSSQVGLSAGVTLPNEIETVSLCPRKNLLFYKQHKLHWCSLTGCSVNTSQSTKLICQVISYIPKLNLLNMEV